MLLRLLLIVLLAAPALAGEQPEQRRYWKLYETFDADINPKLPPVTFRLFLDQETGKFARIEVLQGEEQPKLVQAIEGFTADLPSEESEYFRTLDANFDGNTDILLLSGNTYRVWLYDPTLRSFVFHQQLSELPNLEVHPENHTLSSKSESEKGSAISLYGFEGEKLVQLEEETRTRIAADCSFLRILKKRKNGQLALVSQETISDAGASCKAK